MNIHNDRFRHPLLDALDELETRLYTMGQSLAGESNAEDDEGIERWHPNEFVHHVTMPELERAGQMLFFASKAVTAALHVLTADLPEQHPAPDNIDALTAQLES